jgi:succinate dehydrogenase/fumarate reductase cytochrome b subunit
MIDLAGEVRLWVLHRVTSLALVGLLAVHLAHVTVRTAAATAQSVALDVAGHDLFYVAFALVAVLHALLGVRLRLRLCPKMWPGRGRRTVVGFGAVMHRWAGSALGIYLALHLGVILLALLGVPAPDRLIAAGGSGLVRGGEALLAGVLALHVTGSVRVLLDELLSIKRGQDFLAVLSLCLAPCATALWLLLV